MKKILNFFLVVLLLLWSAPLASAREVADITREGSIQISLQDAQGKKVSGIELSLYKVADVIVDNGYIFEYTPEFSGVQTDIDSNLDKVEYVQQLAEFAKTNRVPALDKITTANNTVSFSHLKMGLYLVRQTNQVTGYVSTNPFLITIPFRNADGSLSYDVDANPKTSVLEKIIPPKLDKKLPLTGQLWWPVWVLVGAGFILCLAGIIGKKRKNADN